MTYSQFFSILRARWINVVTITLATTLAGLGITLVLPKGYTATATVVVDMKTPDPIAGMVLGGLAIPAYIATQMDILTSDRVSRQVVRTLKLTENADLREKWLNSTEGEGDFEAWVADLISKGLEVKPSKESTVIAVNYTGVEPSFAAAVANAYVKAYIDTNVEMRVAPAKQYTTFFDARAKELRNAVDVAQNRLSEYQRDHGILVTDERLDSETQRLNELTSQLVAIQALSSESNNRLVQARGNQSDQLQDVLNNPVVSGLRADISRQEAKLQELSARFGDAHPQVQELKANISELKRRIETETTRVSGGVKITDSINKGRVAEVRTALEQQKLRVAKLKEQRDEAAVLIKDLDAAQRAFDAVSQRLTQTSLESQTDQTNVAVLTQATKPTQPSSPRVVRNVFLALVFGSWLGMGAAFINELRNRKVRSAEDLTQILGLPLLGTLPPPLTVKGSGLASLVMPNNVVGQLPAPTK